MARPKNTFKKRKQAGKGKPFTSKSASKAGKKSSSKGKPNYELEERLVRNVDKSLVSRYINLNSTLTVDEMKAKLQDRGNIPFLEYMIIRVLVLCAQTGDPARLNAILDRSGAGPVKQIVKHEVDDPYKDKSDEELLQMKKDLEARNREIVKNIEESPRYKEQLQKLKDVTPPEELDEEIEL